jgi:hypothetical protein
VREVAEAQKRSARRGDAASDELPPFHEVPPRGASVILRQDARRATGVRVRVLPVGSDVGFGRVAEYR